MTSHPWRYFCLARRAWNETAVSSTAALPPQAAASNKTTASKMTTLFDFIISRKFATAVSLLLRWVTAVHIKEPGKTKLLFAHLPIPIAVTAAVQLFAFSNPLASPALPLRWILMNCDKVHLLPLSNRNQQVN